MSDYSLLRCSRTASSSTPTIVYRRLDTTCETYEAGKPVAAICHAGWVLASAGIAQGKRVTSFFSIKDDLLNAGADWVDEPVVVDGNLITSRYPGDLPQFMQATVQALKSRR